MYVRKLHRLLIEVSIRFGNIRVFSQVLSIESVVIEICSNLIYYAKGRASGSLLADMVTVILFR